MHNTNLKHLRAAWRSRSCMRPRHMLSTSHRELRNTVVPRFVDYEESQVILATCSPNPKARIIALHAVTRSFSVDVSSPLWHPSTRYVNFVATPSSEMFGYGLIDRNCFDGGTTTRESALNLRYVRHLPDTFHPRSSRRGGGQCNTRVPPLAFGGQTFTS